MYDINLPKMPTVQSDMFLKLEKNPNQYFYLRRFKAYFIFLYFSCKVLL